MTLATTDFQINKYPLVIKAVNEMRISYLELLGVVIK
jgi:hypothetical protein